MNERIKELAEQAGIGKDFAISGLWLAEKEELENFAELIRQDEREACAKLCEENMFFATGGDNARAIRARGEK